LKKTFSTTLYVKPIGKGRPRFSKGTGRTYTPEKTASAEAEIKWLLRKEKPPCFEGAVWLDVQAVYLKPKSAPKARRLPVVKPDLSNVLKLFEDAANGILFRDDAQICTATISKRYGDS
jgi:Holliday junction resolvase RusA-like endonuclease